MESSNPLNLPRYFIVGARPVMALPTPTGGMQVLAYDWETGDFIPALEYAMRVLFPDGETDEVTEAGLQERVTQLREDPGL